MLAFALMMALAPTMDATEWELAKELSRFPPVLRADPFWNERELWLDKQADMGGWRGEQAWNEKCRNRRVWHCWDLLRQARDNPWRESVLIRLRYLNELRFMIGDDNYLMGQMPPVALWMDFVSVR